MIGMSEIRERDAKALAKYIASPHRERLAIADMAVVNDDSCLGLMLDYRMKALDRLAEIRNRKVTSRVERAKRKADFFFTMVRVITRTAQIQERKFP